MGFIELKNVCKRYDKTDKNAVTDFNLVIEEKEFIAFVGPSGCGKSTTLRMIAGFEEISSGELYIDGKKMNEIAPMDRGISMVFQNYALYPHLTVRQNIQFPLGNLKGKNKLSKQEMLDRAVSAAKLVQIEELMDRKPGELSGGQQQRAAIARALVNSPRVIFADEPTGSLDSRNRDEIRSTIAGLREKLGQTFVIVTHDSSMTSIADRTVRMADGRILNPDAAGGADYEGISGPDLLM